MPLRFLIIVLIILAVDVYFYQAVLTSTQHLAPKSRRIIFFVYWGLSAATFLFFLTAAITGPNNVPRFLRVQVFAFFIIIEMSKIPGIAFLLIDDIIRLFRLVGSFVFASSENNFSPTRLTFINRLALGIAAVPLGSLLYGMVNGAYKYTTRKVKLPLQDLPDAFLGLRIVQVSDIHCGSFADDKALRKAFAMVQELKPDVIFFTGDLVNNASDEALPFADAFKQLKAPMGVFSIMGNHDYGDYTQWSSPEEKAKNLQMLKDVHAASGWKLLNNAHHLLEKEGQKIAVLGVENWGASLRFPKYGKLDKAYAGTEHIPVKLLLSHDPSHWDAEVRQKYPDIQATFSGHTHGMQFGIEIPGFKWSPVQYFYKQWAGLYKKDKQYLYVNRGLGFIGYPGRVGILPEITLIELCKA